ncbi:MAG: NfeD-like protein [Synechococcales cyanobacterium T60_A2020_003]|nr:NfeD-like protein [Synechococcales cyanobacterium T60_A2020_003]
MYWLCFAIGGAFVLLAVLGGLDGVDFDSFDSDIDSDLDIAGPGDQVCDRPLQRPQSPLLVLFEILTSLKFWTFGICFFGLTGLVLSNLSTQLSIPIIAIIALVMGIVCGGLVSSILRVLREQHANSLIQSDDVIGLAGTVILPFDQDSRGKVQLNVKGSQVERIAYTDEQREFQPGDLILVVNVENDRL